MSLFARLTEAKVGARSLLAAADDLEQAAKELRGLAKSHPEYSMVPNGPGGSMYIVKRDGTKIHSSKYMNGPDAAVQIQFDVTEGAKTRKLLSKG